MGFLSRAIADQFEEQKPEGGLQADIRVISGCEDHQTSADVSCVSSFQLPDPAGRAGGACTSTLLNVLYKDETTPEETLSFVQVLEKMREDLESKNFTQICQLTASHPIDVNADFDLVPPSATGTRRAVMVGINYIGAESGVLSGCHNDLLNMKKYIENVHDFSPDNITVLMDDGEHEMPTRDNILNAYKKLVAESGPGDALFLHYSGHGAKVKDDSGDEKDGHDETLCPVDYNEAGLIYDDELFDILVKPLAKDVHLVGLFDCCHSGTVLDLPYVFKANGEFMSDDGEKPEMKISEGFDFDKLYKKVGVMAGEKILESFQKNDNKLGVMAMQGLLSSFK